MKVVMSILVLILGLDLLSVSQDKQPADLGEAGTVRGRVVDANGTPVEAAEVLAQPLQGAGSIIRVAVTNKLGEFLLTEVPAGENLVSARKGADFYPDVTFAFFATDTSGFPRIDVAAGRTTDNVIVRLPQKGGRLQGSVLDFETRRPVPSARIRLIRQDNPKLYFSTGPDELGNFEFVIPSRPITIEVSATGYKTWSSTSETGPTGEISISPESVKELVVLLRRNTVAPEPRH